MDFLSSVIRASALIEERLEQLGGDGNGLYERAYDIRDSIDESTFATIIKISRVRNRYAHESDYRYPGNEKELLEQCADVLVGLGVPNTDILHQSSDTNARSDPRRTVKEPMKKMTPPDVNSWVELRTNDIHWNTFLSTDEQRIVFLAKGNVESVKPPGSHRVPYFLSTVDAVCTVKMLPGHIEIASVGELLTVDDIPIEIALVATIEVVNKDDAIRRVAIDCAGQLRETQNRILRHVQVDIRQQEWTKISGDLGATATRLIASIQADSDPNQSFRILSMVVQAIRISDPELRDHAVQSEKEKRAAKQLEIARQTQQLRSKYEAEDQAAAWNEDQRRRGVIALGEIEQKKRLSDLEEGPLSKQRQHEIDIKRIEAQTEVLKADAATRTKFISWAIQGAMAAGQLNAAKQLMRGTLTWNDISRAENSDSPSSGETEDPFASASEKENIETGPDVRSGSTSSTSSAEKTGTIKSFDASKGFGLIEIDESGTSLFFNRAAFVAQAPASIAVGSRVAFQEIVDPAGYRAGRVRFI